MNPLNSSSSSSSSLNATIIYKLTMKVTIIKFYKIKNSKELTLDSGGPTSIEIGRNDQTFFLFLWTKYLQRSTHPLRSVQNQSPFPRSYNKQLIVFQVSPARNHNNPDCLFCEFNLLQLTDNNLLLNGQQGLQIQLQKPCTCRGRGMMWMV